MPQTQAAPAEIAPDDVQWLRWLNENIWRETSPNRFGLTSLWEDRELTPSELTRVGMLIRAHELPCVLHSRGLGKLSVQVFLHSEAPGTLPEPIITIGQSNLPGFTQLRGGYDVRHPAAWKALSPFTHNDRNRELAILYSLEAPHEASHYE